MIFGTRNSDRDRDVQAIVDRLLSAAWQDLITFEDFSTCAGGKDIRRRYRHYLEAALKLAQRDHNAVFENVKNIGYVRLPNSKVITFCKKSTQAVGRMATRKSKTITAIASGSNDIPNSAKLTMYATQGKLGVIAEITKERNKVSVHDDSNKPPPLAETAHMLLEHIGARKRAAV